MEPDPPVQMVLPLPSRAVGPWEYSQVQFDPEFWDGRGVYRPIEDVQVRGDML